MRLGTILPREQVGGPTDARYEYQYHLAALECLKLLLPAAARCVYCEWHDDYVTESDAANPQYSFYQVKTRKLNRKPWNMREILGISPPRKGRPRVASTSTPAVTELVDEDSVGNRLFEHYQKFENSCQLFALMTNHGVETEEFFSLVTGSANIELANLDTDNRKCFDQIFSEYEARYKELRENELWSFLQRFKFVNMPGAEDNLSILLLMMGESILEFSEVNLSISEARAIGNQLVGVVRVKSHLKLDPLPPAEEDIRKGKAVVVDEVLNLLSLSPEGFHLLKLGERDAARTLSRLQRTCRRSGIDENLIPMICRLKTKWDAWLIQQRDIIDEGNLIALKSECLIVLKEHVAKQTNFSTIMQQADEIAKRYVDILGTASQLTKTHVVGLIFALVAETGAKHG